jgi:hypothetical protein
MVDAAADLRPLVPQLRSAGIPCHAAAVYLGTGGAGAFVATPQYVSDLHGLGLAILPVFNDSPLNGGSAATEVQAAQDYAAAAHQLDVLGVPAGVYVAVDLEQAVNRVLTGAYLAALAGHFRRSVYGGAGMVYDALFDPYFGAALDTALQIAPGDVGRMLFWLASYVSWSPSALPAWTGAHGPADLPWQAQHRAQVYAWQFCDDAPGPVDLSLLRVPLPAYGQEGLWLPDGSVGQPQTASQSAAAPSTNAVAAAVAALQQAAAALDAARQDLLEG